MVVTDEPGFYAEGEFGIRIEDELVVVKKGDINLGFENFTNCPYERSLIDLNLLSNKDKEFINNYHERVFNNVSPILIEKGDQIAL